MFFLHVTAALLLLALAATVLVQCWVTGGEPPFDEQVPVLGVLTGLMLAAVLFTGFIQLGSRNTIPSVFLHKLGATVAGGILGLLGLFYRHRVRGNLAVFVGTQVLALGCFIVSFYWALAA